MRANRTKELLKDILPPLILRLLSGLHWGWHGNFSSWDEAKKRSTGYNSSDILRKVSEAALKVKNGKAAYERDSVLFDHIEYSFPLLSGLMWIAGKNGKLNVLDFGGSLGSTYFQNRYLLDTLSEVNWCIVEQPEFVNTGNAYFKDNRLHFFSSIDDCIKSYQINVFLLSSVLQYLEKPYVLLEKIILQKPEFIIIDRTPFVNGSDRITVQKVNPKIYKGSYPCWFFNKEKFISAFSSQYDLVIEFDALDISNITSEFKGFIFKKIGFEDQPG